MKKKRHLKKWVKIALFYTIALIIVLILAKFSPLYN